MRAGRYGIPVVLTLLNPPFPLMRILPCSAPAEPLDPAPVTSLPLGFPPSVLLAAFWGSDDAYYIRVGDADAEVQWYCMAMPVRTDAQLPRRALARLGAMLASILPIRRGRVAFPVGSSGRTVYRVWRSKGASRPGRTRILAVRAGRSRRLPA